MLNHTMIYLIGGAPRAGKSKLAQLLLERKKISSIPTDSLVMMLKHAAPRLGVSDEIEHTQKADNFYPFLCQFIQFNSYNVAHFTVEGDAFLPRHANALRSSLKIKCCFLGQAKLTTQDLLDYPSSNNWIAQLQKQKLQSFAQWITSFSNQIKHECLDYKLQYYNMSTNFADTLEEAYEYLVGKTEVTQKSKTLTFT